MTKSKLTFHISNWTGNVIAAIKETKPAYIKTLDPNRDILDDLMTDNPDLRIIYRLVKTPQEIGTDPSEIEQNAVAYAGEIARSARDSIGLIWGVEGYNEPFGEQASNETQQAYDYWMSIFYEPIKAFGYEPLAFSWATGNFPVPGNEADFLGNFNLTLSKYDYLSLHEYDYPTMWRLHYQGLDEGNDGMWLALRYKRLRAATVRLRPDLKFIITECGVARGVIGWPEDVGWLSEPEPVSEQSYFESLLWYGNEIAEDDYVLAACVFKTGGGTAEWETFESTNILKRILTNAI